MKKRNLTSLHLIKKSISNLSVQNFGGVHASYVCPTKAADRPACHSYMCQEEAYHQSISKKF